MLENPYILHTPTPKQAHFLCLMCREALYGGAAGPGKSDALLMGALQFVSEPEYNAILFRRTYQDLMLPEALMARSLDWLKRTDAHWNAKDYFWTFPSGATLSFGYLKSEMDKYRYQSAEFQYIAFDELTQFTESQYRYLFSRLRRLENTFVPLRMRAATNPGGIGHDWVKRRFIIPCNEHTDGFQGTCVNCQAMAYRPRHDERAFVPGLLSDNPYLDQAKYRQSLGELDPITRQQLLNGDWTARHGGSKFRREWFTIVNEAPADAKRVRYWDMAATTPELGKDPDYTCGAKLAMKEGQYWIEHILHVRLSPKSVEDLIQQTAILDGVDVEIYMEQEPGSEGIALISYYARKILQGFAFRGNKATGDKEMRANPVSSAAEASNIFLVNGPWINEFLDEAESFPLGEHDDQIDAVSGAFQLLRGPITVSQVSVYG